MTAGSPPTPRPDDTQLVRLAHEAAANAYVPYSSFPVGACLLTAQGRLVVGCNVENASYGLTICAERTAVTRMVASGPPQDRRIVAVAVVGLDAAPCWPCGACRQVLHEFGCAQVILEDEQGHAVSYPFASLFPHGFGPDDLARN